MEPTGRPVPARPEALLGWAALCGTFATLLLSDLLGHRATALVADYGTTLAAATATVLCWRAARRAPAQWRRSWLLLALASAAWAAGQLSWAAGQVRGGLGASFPSITDAGFLIAVPLAGAAMVSLPRETDVRWWRLRPLLDATIVAGALLAVSWTTVLGPLLAASHGTPLSRGLPLVLPTGDVLTLAVAILALAGARRKHRRTLGTITGALLTIAAADSSFARFSVQGSAAGGAGYHAGWFAGYLLLAVGALRPPAPQVITHRSVATAPDPLGLYLPYAPLLVGIPLAVAAHLRGQRCGPFLFYDGLLVVVAVLGRQLISLRAQAVLSVRLHDTVAILRRREVQLHHQSFHDPLTGLANRELFANRVEHALTRGQRRPGPLFVLLADLDDFRTVNDSLGHPAGDTLLVAVAERVRVLLRPEDTVARLGGDEFAVLLEDARDLDDACAVAERIGEALAHPFTLAGTQVVSTASIGVVTAAGNSTAASLLRDADLAMYAAKRQGRDRYAVYSPALAAVTDGRLQLKNDLTTAQADGELGLLYEPIVDLLTGRIVGVAALLRWNHPERGPLEPAEFLPMAEDIGAILPISRWLLLRACADAGRWQQAAPGGSLGLHVSLTARQLADPDLIAVLTTALSRNALPAGRLTVRLPEVVVLADDDATTRRLQALRRLGVGLAVSDFGNGLFALTRLQSLPLTGLTISGALVHPLSASTAAASVVAGAVVALARGLQVELVAQDVQSKEQLTVLRELDCPFGQGAVFCAADDPGIIEVLIAAGRPLGPPASSPSPTERQPSSSSATR